MGSITIVENVSLDGVAQAPGSPDEDTRGGFSQGGWFAPYPDEVLGQVMGRGMAAEGAMLFGRRTFESMQSAWAGTTDNPFGPVLDAKQKYVVTRDAGFSPTWANTTVLAGDAATTVADLKGSVDVDLTVLGSPDLLATLLPAGLVDDAWLAVAPVVLGVGRTLFPAGAQLRWELVESVPTTTGVVLTHYRLAR
ncbi:dihydrofolate reductase family protein [Geodermatophilus aquaeductus]|uniref:Dihydrofolate reductase n=1 Tax=Geodermatophilus aquaeductus TaxID=1564161 RepID=A0A521DAB0_9ACTN|nr:dihydrofolate reductase family protein [Geodermatophilus aquaeductus]SMO68647.1 Dihydrofolate reductase [Geodermatophilus aquaeductus]